MAKGRIPGKKAKDAAEMVTGDRPVSGDEKSWSRVTVMQSAVAAPTGSVDIGGLSGESLLRLQHLQTSISERLEKGELSAALIREAAGLSRSIIALGSEMRQQEKWYENRAAHLTDEEEDEVVLDFLLELSPRRRQRLLDALAKDGSAVTLLG